MSSLVHADRVEVLVLVDSVTDNLSSTPLFVENEWPRLRRRGMRALSGRCLCCAAHGLSCAITVRRGERARTLLFDTGPDEAVFERNVGRLGFDLGSVDDLVYISGEIPRVTDFEVGLPGQHRRTVDGSGWEPDPLIMDERFVAVAVENKGLVVFTACSYAGVINVLRHARGRFPELPLHGVMGGFHLSGTNERVIPDTVEAMREFDLSVIAAAHCTGWRATGALAAAFGDAVVPSAVGKCYRF